MNPLKIYFKILQTGNGKYLRTKSEVNNLIVDVIDRNPSKSSIALREIALDDFMKNPAAQEVLKANDRFFIDQIAGLEIVVTYLPNEQKLQEKFYTQWRFVQHSEPYWLIQYLDDSKIVVYSERTKVIHTVKLHKDMAVIAMEQN